MQLRLSASKASPDDDTVTSGTGSVAWPVASPGSGLGPVLHPRKVPAANAACAAVTIATVAEQLSQLER